MSRAHPTNTDWKAIHQSLDRQLYRRAAAAVEKPSPFILRPVVAMAEGLQQIAPVRVYGPDGRLREVVSAAEWRRRHGDPFASAEA